MAVPIIPAPTIVTADILRLQSTGKNLSVVVAVAMRQS
jgi:hypothetical protein